MLGVAIYPPTGGCGEKKRASSKKENTWELPPTFIWVDLFRGMH